MEVLRPIKSSYCLLVFVIIICLLWYCSHNPDSGFYSIRILKTTQPVQDSNNLVQVLRRATMQDRTVILTIVDKSWASPGSILDLFLESLHIGHGTTYLLNHLVIVALDTQAFQYCKSIHPHCFHFDKIKPFKRLDRQTFDRVRNDVVHGVIKLAYNVIFTEADVMWLRNPIPNFIPNHQMTIACHPDMTTKMVLEDGGYFFMKSDDISMEFFPTLNMVRVLYTNLQNLSLCQAIVEEKPPGASITFIDREYYGGFCAATKDMSRVCTIRANCCDSVESKIHDLKLVLDDWRNFTAGPERTNSLFRAPDKCKT
ncbi:hypothetical protein HS088_TW11G00532 [Tripterygium wilfordii]|uniref:Nucleotide-diphospho-sugar transferase domain-containing protein n=1 Tax=Tripterygium wilfordii TaxID=458696 RepID=A0A7J7D2C1_TRIWF|nr:uncharacterized protein At4g15970 [Tripterygium wilfordii]KAF5740463.1 hypothetical protein HS088_TW11G00532 [Tripterygium wilfordii]